MNDVETIAAIATAPGAAGIAIVRISGPDALKVANQIFRCRAPLPSERLGGTFVVGQVIDGKEVIDQAILLIMKAPHSYTREDVVEIQGHGGDTCARRVLRAALAAGARPATPGEFTQRAFLNGHLDLVQAEAVLDLIHAKSDRAATAALKQLGGDLSSLLKECYDNYIRVAADLEATLDFPEDELPETVIPDLIERLTSVRKQMVSLQATWGEGHLLRDGAHVVISGKPNVGKSTLLNSLLGRNRAIVSNIPGTTRDTIEEDFILKGIPVRLVDTAGLRASSDEIEQIGVQRTKEKMKNADLHIHMIDATKEIDQELIHTLSTLPREKTMILVNKKDLTKSLPKIPCGADVLYVSVLQTSCVDDVKEKIFQILSVNNNLSNRPQATVSERHRLLLSTALRETDEALHMLSTRKDDSIPLVSSVIRQAIEQMGQIAGRVYHEELLDQIFSRFCIGK